MHNRGHVHAMCRSAGGLWAYANLTLVEPKFHPIHEFLSPPREIHSEFQCDACAVDLPIQFASNARTASVVGNYW